MSNAMLEHVNVTVKDPDKTAQLFCALFDWKVRWQGPAKSGGYTVHVGSDNTYLAVYALPENLQAAEVDYAGLNHIGVLVDDLDGAEARVVAAGFAPYNHGDYEPGRRFYFNDSDGIEFEVVAYG